jgi:hypothetical protein
LGKSDREEGTGTASDVHESFSSPVLLCAVFELSIVVFESGRGCGAGGGNNEALEFLADFELLAEISSGYVLTEDLSDNAPLLSFALSDS